MKAMLQSLGNALKGCRRFYKGKWYKRLLAYVATGCVLLFLYLGAVDINFLWMFGKSPSLECIENPITNEASVIYSADSVMIGKFFNENRSPVDYDEIAPCVIDALVSTEDERFYQHHGIDFQGMFAAFKDIAAGHPRGASTITQQLVKNLFKIRSQYSTGWLGKIPGLSILIMKSKEWIAAVRIENRYSKQEILALYLNTVDFGSNSFGIKTAAKTYFATIPSRLTVDQAATLVGMLKATTTYNPKVHPARSKERRNVVLMRMLQHNKLTQAAYDSLSVKTTELKYNVENNYDGQGQYFREALKDYLEVWCTENGIDLYSDGLKIYTTLDTRLQRYAEDAALKQMASLQKKFDNHWRNMTPWRDERGQEIPGFIEGLVKKTSAYKQLMEKFPNNPDSVDYYLNKPHMVRLFDYDADSGFAVEKEMSTIDSVKCMVSFMHCGFVAMEPQTSQVKAWVGDINFDSWKYDKVTAMRQPGSTFKLFVYAAAFEYLGLTPVDRRMDSYATYKVPGKEPGMLDNWTPHNANGYCLNTNVPLKAAFAQSINTIAVKLGQEVGIDKVVDIAHLMGVKSKLKATPSLALGSSDVSLLELVDAYCTVMDDGMQRDPVLVTKILDRKGEVVYDCDKDVPAAKRAISYKTAYYMQRLLWGGMHEPGGTSQALWGYNIQNYDTEFGGKTGTSSNHSDAWFVGATPTLVGGAWVGGEYRCIHFRTGALGQGSRTALPIFGYFMEKVMADPSFKCYRGKYPQPKEDIDRSTYEGASFYAPRDSSRTDSLYVDDEDGMDVDQNGEVATPPTDGTDFDERIDESAPMDL